MTGRKADPDPDNGELPLIDVHTRRIDADADDVWMALGRMLARTRGPMTTAALRLLGARPVRAAGDPLQTGSTVSGFAVAHAERARELVLEGRHRFSRYALTFRLEPDGAGTVVHAESRAVFPGAPGWAYRKAVIGSGGHVIAVRALLTTVAKYSAG
jgi:hypothetical protein